MIIYRHFFSLIFPISSRIPIQFHFIALCVCVSVSYIWRPCLLGPFTVYQLILLLFIFELCKNPFSVGSTCNAFPIYIISYLCMFNLRHKQLLLEQLFSARNEFARYLILSHFTLLSAIPRHFSIKQFELYTVDESTVSMRSKRILFEMNNFAHHVGISDEK